MYSTPFVATKPKASVADPVSTSGKTTAVVQIGTGTTVKEKLRTANACSEDVPSARTVKLNVRAAVGVPDKMPLGLSVRPLGKEP